MSLFGAIFGGKKYNAFKLAKLKLREETKEHKWDDKLQAKEALDEADKVAYMNHMNPTNRAAGVLHEAAGVIGSAAGLVGAIEGGGVAKGILGVNGGQPPPGYGPNGQPLPPDPMAMLKNPMVLGAAALAILLIMKKK
jgi:hypothetical protein